MSQTGVVTYALAEPSLARRPGDLARRRPTFAGAELGFWSQEEECLVGKRHCRPRPSSPDGLENSTLRSSFSDDCVTAESFHVALIEATCGQNKELEMGPQDRLCSRGLVPASPGLTFCLRK